jgi:hypothetical protein
MKRFAPAAALASGMMLAASSSVLAQGLVLVSATNPYADCTVGAGTGRNYVDAEVEPQVAINPANTANIVGVWQQDRWSNGGDHGLAAGSSFDGGVTWDVSALPFSACAAPFFPDGGVANFERASDPWVSIGPDGTVYANAVSFNRSNNDNAVTSAVSSDGGRTWSNASTIVQYIGNGGQFSTDKNSITADPVNAGVAYQVWDTLVGPTDQPDDNPHAAAYTGPTYFAMTTDFGKTWSTPRVIVNTGNRQQTIGNVIVVDPRSGTLYDFMDLIVPPNPGAVFQLSNTNVAFVKSTNGGVTWSLPQVISKLGTVTVTDPNNVDPVTGDAARIRTGDIIPEAAIDPRTGQLYAVWQDARFSDGARDDVAISTSSDGGKTWSTPKRVDTPNGQPAFTPTVAVAADHTVGVTYYQFDATSRGSEPTNYFIKKVLPTDVSSTNAKSLEAAASTKVTGPFNMLDAPFARGYFVGDYEALGVVGSTFQPFFVQTNCLDLSCSALTAVTPPTNRTPTGNNSTDIFTGRF